MKTASEEDSRAQLYVQILISSVEYNTFVRLMRIMRPVAESKQSLQLQAQSKLDPTNSPSKTAKLDVSMDEKRTSSSPPAESKSSRSSVTPSGDAKIRDYNDQDDDEDEDGKASKK